MAISHLSHGTQRMNQRDTHLEKLIQMIFTTLPFRTLDIRYVRMILE